MSDFPIERAPDEEHAMFWYLDKAEAYEKEYQFDKTIEYLKLYFEEEYKSFKLVFDKRGSKRTQLKCLIYRNADGEADFYYQFYRLSEFYLKIGTSYLRDYWLSLRDSPYYEDGSYFKDMVEKGILLAEEKQAQGYVYKPLTKANQAKFLTYAKAKGWR